MRDPAYVEDLATTIGLKVWPSFIERACCDKKEVFLNGGWRGGKSSSAAFLVLLEVVSKWLMTEGTHLIWLVGPDYAQARQEFFYLSSWSKRLGLTVEASSAMQGPLTMQISFPGLPGQVEVATKQAGDPTSLGSVAPVVILACEAGQFSEEAMLWLLGRTAEKNATLIWSGTFENEEGKAQFAWFEEASERAWTTPSSRQAAFRLPTWENLSLYSSCAEMLKDDVSLSIWCPDNQHGTAHSGLSHPMIRKLQDQWKDKPKDWAKRFGGEPQGQRQAVYEWSQVDKWDNIPGNKYLVSMSAFQERLGVPFRWLKTAGGMDFGVVHPSAITMGSRNQFGQTWVRKSEKDDSGSLNWVWLKAKDWSKKYSIPNAMWGRDPMVKYAPTYLEGEAMSGSMFAREARVGLVEGVRLDERGQQMLFFDADDPGVVLLFREMQRVRWKRGANGSTVYDRSEDDMTASFEDMMAMLHGQPILNIKKRHTLPQRERREYVTAKSAS